MGKRWLLILGLVLLVGAAAAYLLLSQHKAVRYLTAPVERGTIVTEIVAAGTISALVSTEVSSQLSGQITEVLADFNDAVRLGQVLARLDPRSHEARVREAAARLDMTEAEVSTQLGVAEQTAASLANAEALRSVAEAEALSSLAEFNEAASALERKRGLASKTVISEREMAEAKAAYDSKKALLQAARARIKVHDAAILAAKARARVVGDELAHARAEMRQAQAALDQAQLDLTRTEIRSPMDGIVIRRNVDVGQTVAASLQAPTLFTIARDLGEMTLECQVDEADIGRVQLGQVVHFSVDAYPGRDFVGEVVQIRKAPSTFQNVVTYTVVVSAENRDQALFPGMTAIANIHLAEHRDVLRLPNAALRYLPEDAPEPATRSSAVSAGTTGLPATVWVIGDDGEPRSVAVETGPSDERYTALLKGPLTKGDQVIIGEAEPAR